MRIPIWITAIFALALALSGWSAEPVGVAVVIAGSDIKLPDLQRVASEPERVAQEFRAVGLRVVTDPSGRCLAVAPASVITDADLIAGKVPDEVLVTGMAERMTAKQYAARDHCYLPENLLSAPQKAALRNLARRKQWTDDQGTVREAGAHLCLGIWPTWVLQVATVRDGQVRSVRLPSLLRPPTPAAIPKSPLAGSLLWWAWSGGETAWGNEHVTLPAGEYSLRQLTEKLADAGQGNIAVDGDVPDVSLTVAAKDMPLRALLWTVEAATGNQVRLQTAKPLSVIVALPAQRKFPLQAEDDNLLLPVAGAGYLSAANTEAGRQLLATLDAPSPVWLGWRLSDLPAMYRNRIASMWEQENKQRAVPLPPPDPEHTVVLWYKALLIAPGTQQDDGSGGGSEFTLPAI
ncbi:MAG: hypothetical protein ACYDCO_01250 [Armatimonadota bacterium]